MREPLLSSPVITNTYSIFRFSQRKIPAKKALARCERGSLQSPWWRTGNCGISCLVHYFARMARATSMLCGAQFNSFDKPCPHFPNYIYPFTLCPSRSNWRGDEVLAMCWLCFLCGLASPRVVAAACVRSARIRYDDGASAVMHIAILLFPRVAASEALRCCLCHGI